MGEATCVFFAIACANIGVLALLNDASEPGLWFIAGAIWFRLASLEAERR
jgi:hypothetical protein